MSISILVEPAGDGYRARTGGPLDLVVDAPTISDAVTAIRAKIAQRMRDGAVLIEQPTVPPSPIVVPPLAENPLFDEWLRAVEEYRTQCDLEEWPPAGESD